MLRRLWPLISLALLSACSGSEGGPCTSNRDCASGETCVSATCVPASIKEKECTSDENCPLDQYCDLTVNECKASTNTSTTTDAGLPTTDSGIPAQDDATVQPNDDAGEQPNEDASEPNDLGVEPSDAGEPQADATVPNADATVPNADATVPNADASTPIVDAGAPDTGVPPPCSLDADCGDPARICVNSTCTLRCDTGLPCTGTDVCNTTSGRCVPGNIALGGTCLLDAQCASNMCLGLNISMTTVNVCTQPCGASSQCPLDFGCTNISGMNFCLGETIFTPAATFDTPSGGACTQTVNTCQSGWCNTGSSSCIETCSAEDDCTAFGGNCYTYEYLSGTTTVFDNICYLPGTGSLPGVACTTNANCRSGVCDRYTGTCARHCCAESDCGATETCVVYDLDAVTPVKVCEPRSPTAGAGALGATCTTAADCESELCAPTNPDDANSPMKCSTTCCTNADCSTLPLGGRCYAFGGPITDTLLGACVPN